MIGWLVGLARRRPRVVLAIAAVTLGGAAVLGVPAVRVLRSSSQQFQDPSSQYERANAAIRHATGQAPYFGIDVLLTCDMKGQGRGCMMRASAYIASLLSRQRGFQKAIDYPGTQAVQLLSRDGRETAVLAAFSTPAESVSAAADVQAQIRSGSSRAHLAGTQTRFGGPDLTFQELDHDTISDLRRVELRQSRYWR